MSKELTPDELAAFDFVNGMWDRNDGMAGGFAPYWHGWALREAYLKGVAAGRAAERARAAQAIRKLAAANGALAPREVWDEVARHVEEGTS